VSCLTIDKLMEAAALCKMSEGSMGGIYQMMGHKVSVADVPPIRYGFYRIWPAHPIIVALSRVLKVSPWVWRAEDIEEPTVWHFQDRFLVHPSTMRALRNADVTGLFNVPAT